MQGFFISEKKSGLTEEDRKIREQMKKKMKEEEEEVIKKLAQGINLNPGPFQDVFMRKI